MNYNATDVWTKDGRSILRKLYIAIFPWKRDRSRGEALVNNYGVTHAPQVLLAMYLGDILLGGVFQPAAAILGMLVVNYHVYRKTKARRGLSWKDWDKDSFWDVVLPVLSYVGYFVIKPV